MEILCTIVSNFYVDGTVLFLIFLNFHGFEPRGFQKITLRTYKSAEFHESDCFLQVFTSLRQSWRDGTSLQDTDMIIINFCYLRHQDWCKLHQKVL